MGTFLLIVLAVCIVLNVWLSIYTIRREKGRRKLLQDELDGFSNTTELYEAEKRRLEHILAEKTSLVVHLKKALEEKDEEIAALNENPHAGCQDPVDGGEVAVNLQPGDPKELADLRKTYDALAHNYYELSGKFVRPSKGYLIHKIIKAYKLKDEGKGKLAEALGISRGALDAHNSRWKGK